MGNNTTKEKNNAETQKGWWTQMCEDFRNCRNSKDPKLREMWEKWEKRCKYMRDVRGNWKHETELQPRLRRLATEDLDELGGLIGMGLSFCENCADQEELQTIPALELHLLVKRDMKLRLLKEESESESSKKGEINEQGKMGFLEMLPELEAWVYRPGDSITEFKTRLRHWAECLEMYEQEMRWGCVA